MKKSLLWMSAACVGFLALSGCHAGHQRHAVSVSDSEAIFVTGEGEITAKPDRMRLNLGVEARAEKLEEAMADNVKRMTSLREALLRLGVAEKDLKTGQFSVSQVREPISIRTTETPSAPSGELATSSRVEERWVERYLVSNTLEVIYPDLTRAGDLISAAVQAGANNSWGLQFEVTDPEPLQDQAREAAIANARKRAEQIAQAAGVKVGRVLSINEGNSSGVQPYINPTRGMRLESAAFAADSSAAMPIEAGETKVRQFVQVAFAIEND